MRHLAPALVLLVLVVGCRRGEPDAAPAAGSSSDEGSAASASTPPHAEGAAAPDAEDPGTAPPATPDSGELASARFSQPCTITTQTLDAAAEPNCYEVPELMVSGHPQAACVTQDAPRVFTYDAEGRVVADSGGWTWAWDASGTGGAVAPNGSMTSVRSDLWGRIIEMGETTFGWDEHGRRVRWTEGEHSVTRAYAEDGTYELVHDFPDSAEYCEAEVTGVTGDPLRPDSQTFGGCEIYERPRTLTYTRDERGRIVGIDIDTASDGTIEARVTVGYGCW